MKTKLLSIFILLVIVASGAWFYRSVISAWFQTSPTTETGATAPGERRILYWYDSMNPAYKSDKPGKAPDGMDLVPQYADEESTAKTTTPGERKISYWYDPMHPAYKADKPGTAPDCGMDLVPKYADEESAVKDLPPGTVQISSEKQQLIGVRTGKVERQRIQRVLRVVGRIGIDETRVSHIHTKVSGYIEQVYANFVGKEVKAGDPLFSIYSPDLVSTQQEYLIAVRAQKELKDAPYKEVSSGAASLVTAARERLRLWDMSEAEIAALEKDGKVKREVTIYSPATGIVTERAAYQHGRFVSPEMDLYIITDLSSVWMLAEVFEFEVPYVHIGQDATVRLSYTPGKTYTGKVSFINPSVDPKTRTVRVRIELPNPNLDFKPDMYADVELSIDYGTQIVVPQEAVLDSGAEQIVFVARGDGYFEPRPIKIGPKMAGLPKGVGAAAGSEQVIVLSGLRPGETIVTSGNFLIDSESRLKNPAGGPKHQH
ncbi:MAG: efflux RND transporter periplasmic adaptor subunit [Acidobacteria bacterium]|nr:efflux RND transporter periplasmic adaptor subunit [Acidobacteriota bacterium]MCL5287033.1 efflux RND transporter periplasmic adaptor subunit [Acidobacteriota bacterium]